MRPWSTFFTTLILTAWLVAIAVLTAQNPTLVSVKLLGVQSIRMPVGLLLSLALGSSMALMALILLLPGERRSRT
jgi:uncharacterized integral membrane protein